MKTCKHKRTTAGEDRCYGGCVAPHDCNPAAHGGIVYDVTCEDCGATQAVAVNGSHVESGEWYLDETRASTTDRPRPMSSTHDTSAQFRCAYRCKADSFCETCGAPMCDHSHEGYSLQCLRCDDAEG